MSDRVREYIQNRIEGLTEGSDKYLRLSPGNVNDFDTWSALKLILHSTTVNMYTTVLADNPNFKDLYYIDALAGSGVSQYEDGRCFLGSALMAAKMACAPFAKMYFIEQDPEFARALEMRLQHAFNQPGNEFTEPREWEVIEGDANEEIPKIVDEMWERFDQNRGMNYLAFIDNQGMDVKWPAIEKLTPKPYGDLLVNLPISQAIGRNVGVNPETVSEFYGMDITEEVDTSNGGSRDRLHQLYLDRLKGRDRQVQVNTRVDANVGSYYYDMIYATREISGGNGYENTIEYVKEFIEQVHAGDVSVIMDILEGDQSTLASYLPEGDEDVEDQIPVQDDDPQTGLSDFG